MAVKGAIIGDIVGSKYEGQSAVAFGLDPKTVPLLDDKNSFTDDTVMTLAVKRAVDLGQDYETAMHYVGRQYPFCGYGHKFIAWMFAKDPHPYGSFGNGSAMRVAYIGEKLESLEEVQFQAQKSAEVTHNHPEGIKGAIVVASCVWMAKHAYSKDDIYSYYLDQYPYGREYKYSGLTVKELQELDPVSITCQDSVPVALRCFFESKNYEDFLRLVISIKCDTDTIGAIGGGIAEEYYGKTLENEKEILEHYLPKELLNILNGKYTETYYKIRIVDDSKEGNTYIKLKHINDKCIIELTNKAYANELTNYDIVTEDGLIEYLQNKKYTMEKARIVKLD